MDSIVAMRREAHYLSPALKGRAKFIPTLCVEETWSEVPELFSPVVNPVLFLSNRQQEITAELLLLIQPGTRAGKSGFRGQFPNVG